MAHSYEQCEDWRQAVRSGETTLGLDAWIVAQDYPIVNAYRASVYYEDIQEAKAAFREVMRPLAAKVLGEWAADDEAAQRSARSWSAVLTGHPGSPVQFTETLHATGHNEIDTVRRVTCDWSGRVLS